MKRLMLNGLIAALLIAVVGCGGGTIPEGTPPSTAPDVPLSSVKTDMPKGLNPKALPKGTDAGPPAPEKAPEK